MLKKTKGRKEIVGPTVKDDRGFFISPHLVVCEDENDELMKDEIFGPIMILIPCESNSRAIEFINSRPKPLACYIYSSDSKAINSVTTYVSSGSLVVNDSMSQFVSKLPFGGVGDSGYGCYHGDHGFKTFSHAKPVLERNCFTEFMNYLGRYPPFDGFKSKMMDYLLVGKIKNPNSTSWF